MKILVVGSGAREHALAYRLTHGQADAPIAGRTVVVTPGNAGIARYFRCVPSQTVQDIVDVARAEVVDLVVVGPEQPLVDGLVDALEKAGIAAFGPTQKAARLEGEKVFMKQVARDAGVATADFVIARHVDDAAAFLAQRRAAGQGVVVKANGLCAGKGVVVCADVDEAEVALRDFLGHGDVAPRFGIASTTVVVEDLLPGSELSVFALCDGDDCVVLGAARDHKRLKDNDEGPNTGGMGAVGPLGAAEGVDAASLDHLRRTLFVPVLAAMKARRATFRGVLFAGLMTGADGVPHLLEFNVRFGDPETEALLFALDVDLFPVLLAIAQKKSIPKDVDFSTSVKAAVVVVAAAGYPENPERGTPISGLLKADRQPDSKVFYAGVSRGAFGLVSNGGRVLAVAGRGLTWESALRAAYRAVDRIQLEGAQTRRDIGGSVLGDGARS